tara:strand:- start:56 stop:319 length:264 start_codon:yes stop_codon:yes gene_type:complete
MSEKIIPPFFSAGYCTPDAMAECMDGVSDELYKALWKAVSDYEDEFGCKYYEDPMDMYEDKSLEAMWGRFTNKERVQINAILSKEDD